MTTSRERKWLVFYTKARWEKKVKTYLEQFGFEPFLPVQKVLRQWSDRKKKVEAPLFNSYIFVKDIESNIPQILKVPGISWNIRHNGKPAVLRDSEYEIIKRFLDSGMLMETQSIESLNIGDQVEIIDGSLRGAVGVLTGETGNQKFTVFLDGLDHAIRLNIDSSLLKRIY